MILTCPHCDTQFTLDAALLGEKGRTVKCSSCAEQWFQTPEDFDDTLSGETQVDETQDGSPAASEDIDDIDALDAALGAGDVENTDINADTPPEGEPPQEPFFNDETTTPVVDIDGDNTPAYTPHPKSNIFGYIAAAAVFLGTLLMLVLLRGAIMNAVPASVALYEPLGFVDTRAADALIFDTLRLRRDDHGGLALSGNVINTSADTLHIPPIQAHVLDGAGATITSAYISPQKNELGGESDTRIEHIFLGIDNTAASVDMRFVLHKGKINPKDTHKDVVVDDHAPTKNEPHGEKDTHH